MYTRTRKEEDMNVRHVATCRDGGTLLIEANGTLYHIDHRIGTTTPGRIYDDYPNRGKLIDPSLEESIKKALEALTNH
jgi:hypothetical protein